MIDTLEDLAQHNRDAGMYGSRLILVVENNEMETISSNITEECVCVSWNWMFVSHVIHESVLTFAGGPL